MNNKYKITITSPLVRPGVTIETECSEKYLAETMHVLIEEVRKINEHSRREEEP